MNLLEELFKLISNEEKKEDSVTTPFKLSEEDIDAISEKVFAKLTESKKEEPKEEPKEEQKEIEKI